MAYRFNNGRGGVTCDVCNILFDEDLSSQEYKEWYHKDGKPDLCMRCKNKNKKEEKEDGKDLLNDGWRN